MGAQKRSALQVRGHDGLALAVLGIYIFGSTVNCSRRHLCLFSLGRTQKSEIRAWKCAYSGRRVQLRPRDKGGCKEWEAGVFIFGQFPIVCSDGQNISHGEELTATLRGPPLQRLIRATRHDWQTRGKTNMTEV